jgi:Cytochrome P460
MKRISSWVFAAATAACVVASMPFAAGGADDDASPIYGVKLPAGYREWQLVSVAHEAGDLNDLRAILGNAAAMKAFRDESLPFPDGTIIARLAWKDVPSAENNAAFGRAQSFVPGLATNVQFLVKDSKKYAATGGWGFGQFEDGKSSRDEALLKTCFPCHEPAKKHDFVFTRYAP